MKTTWQRKAATKAAALRSLLADGEIHTQAEMAKVGGYRFGARLFTLHRSDKPVHYRRTEDEQDTSRVTYQRTDRRHCSVCNAPERTSLRAQVRLLRASNEVLLRRLSDLREQLSILEGA